MTIIHVLTILLLITLITSFIIFWRKKRYKTALNDEEHKFWDILIKAISALLTIGTIMISATTYLNNQAESIKQKEREYRKEIASKQLEYYTEMSTAIADFLAVASNPDSLYSVSYYNAKSTYEKLYYGKLNLVESTDVDREIQEFDSSLKQFECEDEKNSVNISTLRIASFNVNEAFRNSIKETWEVNLETLDKVTK